MELVSVIMPAYNAEKYISESIESVIAQTFTNWELIIVDDGSVDGTAEICNHFKTIDNRIKYIFQHNKKQGAARNTGIKHSKGTLIAFLDSDDIWMAEKLKTQLEYMKNYKADLVFSAGFVFIKDIRNPENGYDVFYGKLRGDKGFALLVKQNFIPIPSVLVTRYALQEVGGFDERPAIQNVEDYHLWLKLVLKGFVFYGMSERLFYYRQHANQATSGDPNARGKVLFMLNSCLLYPERLESFVFEAKLLKAKNWYVNDASTRVSANKILLEIKQIDHLRITANITKLALVLFGVKLSKKVMRILVKLARP